MEKGTERTKDVVQRLWFAMGQEGKEEEQQCQPPPRTRTDDRSRDGLRRRRKLLTMYEYTSTI
jgi:hypothetical protein